VLKAAVLFAALVYFCLAEPANWLLCPFRRLTTLPCPLCGMTHALCAIGHGQFRRAVQLNAVSPVMFAMFAGGFVTALAQLGGWLPVGKASTQRHAFGALLVLLLGYWVWRLVGLPA
jgi:hypothetical protein